MPHQLPTVTRLGALVLLALLQVSAASIFDDLKENVREKRKAGTYIAGGQEIPIRKFLVHISAQQQPGAPFQTLCGGAAIERKWILSAAHCFPQSLINNPGLLKVTMGEHDLKDKSGAEEEYGVEWVFAHKAYNGKLEDGVIDNSYDIALLKLKRDLNLTASSEATQLINLNTDPDCPKTGSVCKVMGWGKLNNTADVTSDKLMGAFVPAWDFNDCKARYTKIGYPVFGDSIFCLGYKDKTVDSCKGDSGGPVVCRCGGRAVHAGVVSFGVACGTPGWPGVYARTSSFLPWIRRCIRSRGMDCYSKYMKATQVLTYGGPPETQPQPAASATHATQPSE